MNYSNRSVCYMISSQVVVANDEDSERMMCRPIVNYRYIGAVDGFSSDTSEISDITESDIPDSF